MYGTLSLGCYDSSSVSMKSRCSNPLLAMDVISLFFLCASKAFPLYVCDLCTLLLTGDIIPRSSLIYTCVLRGFKIIAHFANMEQMAYSTKVHGFEAKAFLCL